MNLALINPRVWLELAVVALIAVVCWWGYDAIYARGEAHKQLELDEYKLQITEQSLKLKDENDTKTADLLKLFNVNEGQKNEQIDSLNNHLADALSSLRNRPNRPAKSDLPNNPADAKTGPSCTGAGLYRPDAEFLAGYATDTARLQLELKACYTNYDESRKTCNAESTVSP